MDTDEKKIDTVYQPLQVQWKWAGCVIWAPSLTDSKHIPDVAVARDSEAKQK